MANTRPDEGEITVEPVLTTADKKAFLDLPVRLHRGDPNWIAPLRMEERKKLDPHAHPFYEHGEAAFFLARRGGRPVGRIAALINRLHLERHSAEEGHFGLLDAEDDQALFDALFAAARGWLKERGMKRMLGPFNLSINEELGLLIEGYDTPPMIMMGHAPAYYKARYEAAGLEKAKDLYAFLVDITRPMNEAYEVRLSEIRARAEVTMRHSTRRSMERDLRKGIEIFNDAWSDNWGFLPVTDAEVETMLKSVKHVILPRGIVFGELEGEPIAMMAAIPDVNWALRGLDGKLLPFGWAKFLWRLKLRPVPAGRVFLLGVKKQHQRTLTGAMTVYLLLENLRQAAIDAGYRKVEMSWILEDNRNVLKYFEDVNFEPYKTYRIYQGSV